MRRLSRERLSRGTLRPADAVHRREPLLRLPLDLVLDPRDIRDRRLPHHRRRGPRRARRPHRAPDELRVRIRRGVRLPRRSRLLRRRSGRARLLLGTVGLLAARAGSRRSSSWCAARCAWPGSTSRPTSWTRSTSSAFRSRRPRPMVSTLVLATPEPLVDRVWMAGLLALTIILSYLMISTIRYRSFKDLDLKRRRPAWILPLIAVVFVVIAFRPTLSLLALTLVVRRFRPRGQGRGPLPTRKQPEAGSGEAEAGDRAPSSLEPGRSSRHSGDSARERSTPVSALPRLRPVGRHLGAGRGEQMEPEHGSSRVAAPGASGWKRRLDLLGRTDQRLVEANARGAAERDAAPVGRRRPRTGRIHPDGRPGCRAGPGPLRSSCSSARGPKGEARDSAPRPPTASLPGSTDTRRSGTRDRPSRTRSKAARVKSRSASDAPARRTTRPRAKRRPATSVPSCRIMPGDQGLSKDDLVARRELARLEREGTAGREDVAEPGPLCRSSRSWRNSSRGSSDILARNFSGRGPRSSPLPLVQRPPRPAHSRPTRACPADRPTPGSTWSCSPKTMATSPSAAPASGRSFFFASCRNVGPQGHGEEQLRRQTPPHPLNQGAVKQERSPR